MLANVQVQEIAAERTVGDDAPPVAEVPALPAPTPPRPHSDSGRVRAGAGAAIAPQVRLEPSPPPSRSHLLYVYIYDIRQQCELQHIGGAHQQSTWCSVLQHLHLTRCGVMVVSSGVCCSDFCECFLSALVSSFVKCPL